MMFKELRSGFPIFLFDRNSLVYEQAKVMNVVPNYNSNNLSKVEVNVTIQTKDGKQNTYSVSDAEQSAYAGNLLITTSKSSVINEVNAIKSNSEEILAKINEHKEIVEKCGKLLGELDTSFRDKQETESRLSKLEDGMAEILQYIKSKN